MNFFYLLISTALASLSIVNIGESCDRSATFNITSFAVAPYPFSANEQYVVTMTGTFVEKEYIEEIYIGTRFERKSWTYAFQPVNQEYAKGTSQVYTISLQAQAAKGTYTDQFTLHRSDRSYVSCWEYNYSLA